MSKITKEELIDKCADLAGRKHALVMAVQSVKHDIVYISAEAKKNNFTLHVALASLAGELRVALHDAEEEPEAAQRRLAATARGDGHE